jgi:hypothetical protein
MPPLLVEIAIGSALASTIAAFPVAKLETTSWPKASVKGTERQPGGAT